MREKPKLNAEGDRPRIIFLVSHLVPLYGMEKTAEAVALLTSDRFAVELLAVAGNVPHSEHLQSKSLGGPLRGRARLLSVLRLWREWRKFDGDVVVLVGVWAALPWLVVRILRHSPAAVVVWEHSLINERIHSSRKLRLLDILSRVLYRSADLIVAVSPPLASDLQQRFGDRVVVTIPNPVGASDVSLHGDRPPKRDVTRILTVGSLTAVKRTHLAIEVVALLNESYHLTIVGDGPEREALEQLVDDLKLKDRVTFTGYLSAEAVAREISSHDILLHCSVVETFGLVLLEAANLEVDVIATKNRVTEWLIPEYVPGMTSEATAAELSEQLIAVTELANRADSHQLARDRRRLELAADRVADLWQDAFQVVLEKTTLPDEDQT